MADQVALPALDNTMGVLYIGVIFAMGLWGCSCVQTYYYYDRYTKDELWLKLLVFTVWALDTTHQGLIIHTVYDYLVTHYGQPAYLGVLVKSLFIEVAVSALVIMLVQSFFILRIWKLSHHNYFLVGLCTSAVLANVIVSMIYTARSLKMETFLELQSLFGVSKAVNICSAASDVLIAGSLIYLLQGSRTGFARSDSIINRLMLFSLNTGLLTCLDAIASLITVTVLPTTFIYIMFFLAGSRLYTNSLMATLNSRRATANAGLGDDTSGDHSVSLQQKGFRSRAVEVDAPNTVRGLANNPHTLSIKVATETVHDNGDDLKQTPSEDDNVYHYGKR